MSEDLPVSIFALREAENGFKPLLSGTQRGMDSILWLEYEAMKDGISIQHRGNNIEARITVEICGKTKTISVDGFNQQLRRVYEYVPCSFHSFVVVSYYY